MSSGRGSGGVIVGYVPEVNLSFGCQTSQRTNARQSEETEAGWYNETSPDEILHSRREVVVRRYEKRLCVQHGDQWRAGYFPDWQRDVA